MSASNNPLTVTSYVPKQSVYIANTHNMVQVLYEDIKQRTIYHPDLNFKLRITSVTGLSMPVSFYLFGFLLMSLNVL